MTRFTVVITVLIVGLLGCTPAPTSDTGGPLPDEAQELPQEAQLYIQMSREALAEQVGIAPEDIELDSVTEPATPDERYIIKLVVDGTTYTYHGQEEQVSLVSTER